MYLFDNRMEFYFNAIDALNKGIFALQSGIKNIKTN